MDNTTNTARVMTKEGTLIHAAWIVTLACGSSGFAEWTAILDQVRENNMPQNSPWSMVIDEAAKRGYALEYLLAQCAAASRALCAQFPQHDCQNGATNDYEVATRMLETMAKL